MITDVDAALRAMVRARIPDEQVGIAFDAPTREWSAKHGGPTIDLYLYDIREDLARRTTGPDVRRDAEGYVTARDPAPRHFRLSYLVTAWTGKAEEEHLLLAEVLRCFLRSDCLPADLLQGDLLAAARPIPVSVALPPPQDRAISDVWSAMGGELKPSLDVVVVAPMPMGETDIVTSWAQRVVADLDPARAPADLRPAARPARPVPRPPVASAGAPT